MKKLTVLLSLALSPLTLIADHHASTTANYGMADQFAVTNPAAVVGSMQTFMNSETGKNRQVGVSLVQIISNGESKATHQINVFYPSLDEIERNSARNAQSVDWARYMNTMSESAERVSENMFSVQMSQVNQDVANQPGSTSMLTMVKVTDPSTYIKAMEKMMSSEAAAAFPGAIYFGQIIGGGENPATHWVNIVAADMASLISANQTMMQSDDFAKYRTSVASAREVVSQSLQRIALTFTPTAEN